MPEGHRRELTAELKRQKVPSPDRDAQAFAPQIRRGKGLIGANFGVF
jgi:hypothetical protein